MRLSKEEKEICKKYSKRDNKGLVHCNECPLAYDKKYALCKANISKKDYILYKRARQT